MAKHVWQALADSFGGSLRRRIVVGFAFLAILFLVKLIGERVGLFNASFDWALIAIGMIVVLIMAIGKRTVVDDRLEASPAQSQRKLMERPKGADADAGNNAVPQQKTPPPDDTIANPANKHPLVGTVFADNYQIESFLGSGGMSTVVKAHHLSSQKVVAIKLLHPRMLTTGNYVQRFLQEAKAAALLNHPNLVAVSDFAEAKNGQPFLVMDYVEGISLSKKLRLRKKLTVGETIEISREVLQTLAHVHENGVVHRDLKPSNIMLEKIDGGAEKVRLVDFGLAKMLPGKNSGDSLTKAGELVGSPVYMSPEYCIWGTCDEKTDLYALGCVMYECLTGKPPFDGKTPLEILTKHMNESVPPVPAELHIPTWLQAIIFKALAKDPKERIQSAREFLQALSHGQEQSS